MAGIAKDTTLSVQGCQIIEAGSKAEIVERYPSAADYMRVVKVKVTSPRHRGPVTGYTIELDK
jgi:hypothetical protein